MHDLPAKHKKRQPKGEMSGRTHNENHRRFGSWQQPRRRRAHLTVCFVSGYFGFSFGRFTRGA